MEPLQLQPLNGEGFDSFLNLIHSESKGPEFHAAWQSIEKNVQQFSGNSTTLDFNEIFIEVMVLEMLAYPILLEDAYENLKSGEFKKNSDQVQAALDQMKSLKNELRQLKKEDPELAEQFMPLFGTLKSIYHQMRAHWISYKKEWQDFQFSNQQEKEQTEEKIVALPRFSRVGWKVIQISFGALLAEIQYRTKWKEVVTTENDVLRYPLFQILIEEIQEIHEKAQGFELLERAQLAQTRNKQLAQKLQFLYGSDPILPEKVRNAKKQDSEENHSKSAVSSSKGSKKVLLIFPAIGLIIGGLALLSLISKPPSKQTKSFQSQSSKSAGTAPQKSSPLIDTATKRKEMKNTFRQLADSKRSGVPVYAPNESMKKLTDAQEVTTEMLQKTMKETKALAVLVADESVAYLISGENLLRFETLEELETFLDKVVKQYQRMVEVAEVLQEKLSQYQVSVLTSKEGGNAGYNLVLRNKDNQVIGQINFKTDALELQWKNMNDSQLVKTTQELINAIRNLEISQ